MEIVLQESLSMNSTGAVGYPGVRVIRQNKGCLVSFEFQINKYFFSMSMPPLDFIWDTLVLKNVHYLSEIPI